MKSAAQQQIDCVQKNDFKKRSVTVCKSRITL